MRYKIITSTVLAVSVLTLLPGCFYRLTIQQGNIVSEQARAKLRMGMSKSEVVALLGRPVLDNAFEDNRWYYIYTQQKGNEKRLKKGYVLYFSHDRLEKIVQE